MGALLPRIFAGDGHVAPVHDQGIRFPSQRNLVGIAIGGDFCVFPCPTPDYLAVQPLIGGQEGYRPVHLGM
ncbi:MAG: hypothetical protein ACPLUL_07535 [Thermanaerothrix sp.]|uniref:hypothetical protein n=1 Tax=Thermanaerothrix sp. TaxID=2972675 RepID=UPI003C7CF5BD